MALEPEQEALILEIANERMGLSGPAALQHLQDKEESGIWLEFLGDLAFLGDNQPEAVVTASRGDWWIQSRDGLLRPERQRFKLRLDREPDGMPEESPWANLYYDNLKRAQTHASLLVRPVCARSEMDPGEPVGPEDLKVIYQSQKTPGIPTTTIHLYKLMVPGCGFWFWKTSPREYNGTYVFDPPTYTWREIRVSIRPDGYTVHYGDPIDGSELGSELCGELIIEDESQNLLNFKLLDRRFKPIVRLVGDGFGGIVFHEFNLDY